MTSLNEINDILIKIWAHDFKAMRPIFAEFSDIFTDMEICEYCGLEQEHPVHHQTSREGT